MEEVIMVSFGTDKQWLEAKKVIGDLDWIEIVSYYRFVGGRNAFVFTVGEGEVRQIIDIIDEDKNVLLLNDEGQIEVDTFDNVTKSKKIFKYTTEVEEYRYELGEEYLKITAPIKDI